MPGLTNSPFQPNIPVRAANSPSQWDDKVKPVRDRITELATGVNDSVTALTVTYNSLDRSRYDPDSVVIETGTIDKVNALLNVRRALKEAWSHCSDYVQNQGAANYPLPDLGAWPVITDYIDHLAAA
jgi:hypothetical protein